MGRKHFENCTKYFNKNIDQGGLKRCHYTTKVKALKLSWIKRFCNETDANWKPQPKHFYKCIDINMYYAMILFLKARIQRKRKYLSFNHIQMLFNVIVFPHFDYCSQSWTNASKPNLATLNELHKRAQRILLQVPKRHPGVVLTNLNVQILTKSGSRNNHIYNTSFSSRVGQWHWQT